MASYQAPLKEMQFILNDVWDVDSLIKQCPQFSEISSDLIEAVLKESAKLSETLLFPLNRTGDEQGCRLEGRDVHTPDGFKNAYKTFQQAGWPSLASDPEYGGQGLPEMVNVLFQEMCCSSNVSFSLYPELTHGVAQAITTHASSDLTEQYVPKLVSGEWTGVMCLTEPHCGSDLGLLRTKAEKNNDDTYQITGTKIFITGGEHDLTDNIIHLVLARIPDAPEGVKGISLFLVPKFISNANGELGERNHVYCGSIEHKMGIRGSSTCVMNYDGATGYLVGEPHQGLKAMFTVMNIERLAIGMQGLGLAEVAYQNARNYAKERLQGRAPQKPRYPDKPADPIIVHPDIRRMLLTIKSLNEAARALAVWTARQVDLSKHDPDENTRKKANAMVALLTPVIKAYFTDYGLDACNMAMQIFGGHGYISEWGIEQFVRDVRVAQIYEGTNGIQAMDLVRRKLVSNKGALIQIFVKEIKTLLEEYQANDTLNMIFNELRKGVDELESVSQFIIEKAKDDPSEMGAAASDYLEMFALISFGYMWAKIASVCLEKSDDPFHQGKLKTATFFFERIFPKVYSLAQVIEHGGQTMMALSEEQF